MDNDDYTYERDLTDPAYWEEVLETKGIELDWTAEQQAEWDAMFYAIQPDAKPLNDDFTTT